MTEQEDRQGIFQQKIKCVFLPPEEQPAQQQEEQPAPKEQPAVVEEQQAEPVEPVTVRLFCLEGGGVIFGIN